MWFDQYWQELIMRVMVIKRQERDTPMHLIIMDKMGNLHMLGAS